MDESQGTGKGYDRLYFDLNRDLDLRNDPVVMPQQHPHDTRQLELQRHQAAGDLRPAQHQL